MLSAPTHIAGTGPHVTKFKPSKRIRGAHRSADLLIPLRRFAQNAIDLAAEDGAGPDLAALGAAATSWLRNKAA